MVSPDCFPIACVPRLLVPRLLRKTLGSTAEGQPWVHDIDESTGFVGDPCSDFHAGIEELYPVTDCDCNSNGTRDKCDIEDCMPTDVSCQDCDSNGLPDECDLPPIGSSSDCNGNGIPDGCEPDCNENGIADECDISGGTSMDCDGTGVNGNGIPDECEFDCDENGVADTCDIARGTLNDVNGDGIPDECLPIAVCGNGIREGGEECDPGDPDPPDDVACPGECVAAGDPNECTCSCPYMAADVPQPPCTGCADCTTGGDCEDRRIQGFDGIGYTCAWTSGCNDDIAGAARSTYMFVNGEGYCWNDTAQTWDPTFGPPPASGCCEGGAERKRAAAGVAAVIAPTGRAIARIVSVNPGPDDGIQHVRVSITTEVSDGASVALLECQIPEGWDVTDISDGGAWDGRHRKVKWGPFLEEMSRTVTLNVSGSAAKIRPGDFSGTVSVDGVNHPIAVQRPVREVRLQGRR